MKRWLQLMAMLSIVGIVLVFPYTPVAHAQAPAKALKIGLALPLSGGAAGWGIAIQELFKMQIEEIKAAGGFAIGGQKYVWELVAYDHKYIPSEAVNVVKRLVEMDKVKYIGNLGGANVIAAQAVTEPNKVLQWGYAYGGKKMINPKNFYTFQYGLDAETTAVLYHYLVKNKGLRRVALIKPDDETGWNYVEFDRFVAKQTGIEIIAEKFCERTTSDFYPILTPVVALKPDLVDVSSMPPNTVALLQKQAKELGYKGPFFSAASDFRTMVSIAGWEGIEGYYTAPYLAELSPKQKAFQTKFIEKYGKDHWIGSILFSVADHLNTLTEGIKGCQSLETTAVANYLTNMKIDSMWGSGAYMGGSKYYGIRRILVTPVPIGQVVGGKVIQIGVAELPAGMLD